MILANKVSNLVVGHVLDSNPKHVESALQFYDKQLYLKWNPKKVQGHGCWELRRRPEHKQVLEVVEFQGMQIQVIGYKEYDWVHHVKDFAFCNYDILTWCQASDSFKNGYAHRRGLLGKVIEDNIDRTIYDEAVAVDQEQDYIARQNRGEWRKVMQDLDSGTSLTRALAKRGF